LRSSAQFDACLHRIQGNPGGACHPPNAVLRWNFFLSHGNKVIAETLQGRTLTRTPEPDEKALFRVNARKMKFAK
jgi:hypothetical protein